MALNLNEIFSPAAIAAYWTNDPTNAQPYASDALFPARKKVSMELKWLRGHKGVGVSLKPSVFDTKATFRTRKGIQVTETNMPFFREGVHIDESDRQDHFCFGYQSGVCGRCYQSCLRRYCTAYHWCSHRS